MGRKEKNYLGVEGGKSRVWKKWHHLGGFKWSKIRALVSVGVHVSFHTLNEIEFYFYFFCNKHSPRVRGFLWLQVKPHLNTLNFFLVLKFVSSQATTPCVELFSDLGLDFSLLHLGTI